MGRTAADAPGRLLVSPFVVVIDTREQLGYQFAGIRADAALGRRPVLVRTVTRCLDAGDYSLEGHEEAVAVERKSLADLYGTLGQGRARFVRELQRLAAYDFAAIVVEAEWSAILGSPPEHSLLNPKTVHRSIIAWQQRFPSIHWWPCPGRGFAEVTTYRILERWWKDHAGDIAPPEPAR